MGDLRHTTFQRRSLSVALPGRLSAPCAIVMISAGTALTFATGTSPTGGPTVSAFNFQPAAQAAVNDRRRRLSMPASKALSEIRLWTGLAWGAIAEMLHVSRKTIHNWTSGEEPSGVNADRLFDLHERAERLADKLGPTGAGFALTAEKGVELRGSRASPRRAPQMAGAILENDRSLVAAPLQVIGKRTRRPIAEV